MENRPDDADRELELTSEEIVAADEAMLLDLGGAEELADLIADQSLGEAASRQRVERAATTDAESHSPDEEGHPPSAK